MKKQKLLMKGKFFKKQIPLKSRMSADAHILKISETSLSIDIYYILIYIILFLEAEPSKMRNVLQQTFLQKAILF